MYECGKLKKVLGNKLGYQVILEQCGRLKYSKIFASIIFKINPFFHVYYTKFIEKISLSANFEFSQKFPVKYQIFLHI